jgi:hypothetical protein
MGFAPDRTDWIAFVLEPCLIALGVADRAEPKALSVR